MTEIWKDIVEYTGYYQVSNLGRIKAMGREVPTCDGKIKHLKERIISIKPNKRGYMRVRLNKNKVGVQYSIHRLVAHAFIPNIAAKPAVNHIDGNKQNNHVSNLEWCTFSENNLHAHKTGLCPNKSQMEG